MALAGTVVCALAAWVSLGVLTVVSGPASPRVGLLPPWWVPVIAGVVLLALACWRQVPAGAWWPALIPGVLLLPWMPVAVPPVFLLWAGPMVWLVWAAAAGAVTLTVLAGKPRSGATGNLARSAWLAFALSLAFYAAAAWTSSAIRPIGDEPQYLIITQSLLLDGDLQIENNHRREDYAAYYSGVLKPDYLRRGQNGQIYSVHAPGLPALVAPAFAVAGYRGVVVFLLIVSALGAWLVWRTSFALTGSAGAAWFGWAAVCLSVPFVCHSGAVFPDGPGAVLLMTGIAALVTLETGEAGAGLRARAPGGSNRESARPTLAWLLHGAALAALPWLHTRFALAAAVVGAAIALRLVARRRFADLAAFAALPLVGAASWFGFFYVVYGRFDPAAPYGSQSQGSLANLWTGLPGLLLDQQYGLLTNAPVYAIAFAGLALLFRARARLAVELAALLLVYVPAVASYGMWWGGRSAPARFVVPVLLALGPCAAWFWARGGVAARVGASVALAFSIMVALVLALVDGGRLLLNSRDGVARWLEWLCPAVDLPRALPSLFWQSVPQALVHGAAWIAVMLAAWLAVHLIVRRQRGRGEDAGATAMIAASAAMCFFVAVTAATSIGWSLDGAVRVTPTSGQLRLLSAFDPSALPLGVTYRPIGVRPASEVVERLRVSVSERRKPLPNAPPLWVRDLPAGTYRLLPASAAWRPRDVKVTVFKSTLPIQQCVFESAQPADCIIRVPANILELNVRTPGAPPPPAGVARLFELQPVDPLPASDRPSPAQAIAAARFGRHTVFAFDELAFLEPTGLWVSGGVDASIVVGSDEPRASMAVLLRNGAKPNTIHLSGRSLRLDLVLAPREERVVELPLAGHSRAAVLRVRADQGFKPSEIDPGSRDQRYLGVWIQPLESDR